MHKKFLSSEFLNFFFPKKIKSVMEKIWRKIFAKKSKVSLSDHVYFHSFPLSFDFENFSENFSKFPHIGFRAKQEKKKFIKFNFIIKTFFLISNFFDNLIDEILVKRKVRGNKNWIFYRSNLNFLRHSHYSRGKRGTKRFRKSGQRTFGLQDWMMYQKTQSMSLHFQIFLLKAEKVW